MKEKSRKLRTPISDKESEMVVKDYHDGKMSITALSKKYSRPYQSMKNIITNNPYGFWEEKENKPIVKPLITKSRSKLTDEERTAKLSDDALQIIELSFDMMLEKLETKDVNLTASKLAEFVKTVIPYVKEKKGENKGKEDTPTLTSRQTYDMFKQQVS